MRFKILSTTIATLILSTFAFAASGLENAVRDAVSENKETSSGAIQLLRANKQDGLNALFEAYSAEIRQTNSGQRPAENWARISAAIDSVAMQKDAHTSRLYWYTDFEEAKKAAAASGKPIISLRLLGNLNEEYSCANSRFFRSILYSDPEIAKTLRGKYVLHWESVRPAPKITIDFGNGRKLVRTITGNSIHYVLDSRGIIIDALPGLYSPKKFEEYLARLSGLADSGNFSPRMATAYRTETARAIIADWRENLVLLGKSPDQPLPGLATASADSSSGMPTALDAAPLVVTKMAVEIPTVLSLLPEIERLKYTTEINDWRAIADLGGAVKFSPESVSLMRSKTSNLSETEFAAMLENLRTYVALDTAQNEYRFHTKILTWLNPMTASRLSEFNESVYAELFLTPSNDQWLGLYSPDIYSAIENGGLQ